MSKHLFGMVLTHHGIYANNRGETEGNATTLQKVLRNGELYTTVSSESIRYAIREGWQMQGNGIELNRTMSDHRTCTFRDREFSDWANYIDDDILGFMHARQETTSRRGLMEITRAISTTPWRGEIMHNFASRGSNPAVTGNDPIPYAVEVHDTRYQFGFAITPAYMGREGFNSGETISPEKKKERLKAVLEGIANLRRVGGNHARYLADYSPEAIVLRWTDDPAPRFLYCFMQSEEGVVGLQPLLAKINGGDISADEIIVGTSLAIPELLSDGDVGESHGKARASAADNQTAQAYRTLTEAKVVHKPGVKAAIQLLLERIAESELY